MKLLDKLKNALFEEEYVEVEETVQKSKKEKNKKKILSGNNKDSGHLKGVRVTNYEDDAEEAPIARKIAPVKKESGTGNDIISKREEKVSRVNEKKNASFNDDSVIKVTEIVQENDANNSSPKSKIYNQEGYNDVSKIEKHEKPLYQKNKKDDDEVKLYKTSIEDEYIKSSTANEYGNYEKTKAKKAFKASPNISPVYGIIDDQGSSIQRPIKQEVRLTSAVRNDKVDVDDVRRKAYGTLVDDLSDRLSTVNTDELKENLMIDLRENNAPEVNKITMEDAEEYFEDLGLEYDTDYIDASKAKASGRRLRSEVDYDSPKVEEVESSDVPSFLQEDSTVSNDNQNNSDNIDEEKTYGLEENKIETNSYDSNSRGNNFEDDELSEDNLFDLIDSMYDK